MTPRTTGPRALAALITFALAGALAACAAAPVVAPSVADLAGLVAALAGVDGVGVSDGVRVDTLDVLERVKAACAAAQARGEALWLAGESDVDVVVVCSSRPGVHDVPTIAALREEGEGAA